MRHRWPEAGLQRALEALLLASLFACGGTQQLARLGDFTTQSGEVISDCRLGFRTFGRLDPARSNAVLVPGWFLGTSQELARQIGPGGVVDSDRFFVVAVDPLGNGVSSSPSQGLQRFPPLTIEDQVQAQFLLVTRILGLEHLAAVVGTSMGGMQALGWSVLHPGFADAVVSIAGTPRASEVDRRYWEVAISQVRAQGNLRRGAGALWRLEPLRALQQLSISADDFAVQAESMRNLDLTRHAGGSMARLAAAMKGRILLVVSARDEVVDPAPSRSLASVSGAELVVLDGRCGHAAPSCERPQLIERVSRFLEPGGQRPP